MNIVITGSLGNISKPLTEELINKGHSVTVISSDPLKQKLIQDIGAKAAIGSLTDINFLIHSFTGVDAVYCMIPPNYTHPNQIGYYKSIGKAYQQAILKSGVKRVVVLSSYGAHLPSGTGFIEGAYHVEQILNAVPNIILTHLRPTFFYYNLLAFVDMIKSAGFIGSVYGGEARLTMVSPQDIAMALAEELVKTKNIEKIRYVSSDERTCSEVASVIGKAIGIPDLKWLILPEEDVLSALKSHGMTEESANKLIELGKAIHTGKLREDYDLHTHALGNVKLEDYAVEFARIYNSK
ncbi:MAG: NAD(P)H-binding protein [Sporocytophaga sp.]|uniref:NmrA family NAD(P)-binding protein n=1 Tax=Sporocytophaga sp. TaxID=2231183 RepID=UPI001B0D919D|nr:NmrA family NAD(P)-binding protein [Sporocytophaga sp.]MBO9703252.1 NAD(P)H-binding protein [Sporocytophaga sp.]